MTLGLSIFFLKEKPTLRFLLGGLISIGGLFYLLGQGDPKLFFKQGLTVGVGLLLIASFAYALYGVFLKRWPTRLTRWQSLYVQAVCGTIMLLPVFLLSTPGPIQLSHLPLILYAGVIASVFAPFLWMMGVEKLGPSLASIFMNLLPVATSVIAVLFLHEELHGYHFIGGGFTLLGVLLAQLDGRR